MQSTIKWAAAMGWLVTLSWIATGAMAQDDAPNTYPELAAGLIGQGVLVVDVRSAEEIQQTGVLANAAAIPHTQVDDIVALIGKRPERTVVLYCGSGMRVSRVIDELRARGYGGGVNAGSFDDLQAALSDQ
ncbi:MAG: rhodanese-like domain-containing protein [Pseudomonadota bacterium]